MSRGTPLVQSCTRATASGEMVSGEPPGNAQSVPHVGLRLGRLQGPQVIINGNPLRELAHGCRAQRQSQLWLADQDSLQ